MSAMYALVKLEPAVGLCETRAEIPQCGPDDVLIKIHRTAICGTDLHIYKWDAWAAATIAVPMIVGHEYACEIVQIGARVTRKLHVGQRVSGEGHIIDTNSAAARAGRFHLDPATVGVGVNRQGAFANYPAIPAFNVVPLPDDVSYDVASLLDDRPEVGRRQWLGRPYVAVVPEPAVSTVYRAAERRRGSQISDELHMHHTETIAW